MSEFNEIQEIAEQMNKTTTSTGSKSASASFKATIASLPLVEVKELKTLTKTGFNGVAPVVKAAKINAPAETTAGVKACCESILTVLKNVGLTE